MFQLPSAKRVCRNELQSPASSPRSSPDPALEDLLCSRVHKEFTFTAAATGDTQDGGSIDVSDDGEAELRLFATAATTAPQTHKIRLASPDLGSGEPDFIVKRPKSYYFAEKPTTEKENEFKAAAVDGETVLAMAKEPWPGCALPWKVQKISSNGLKKVVLVGHPPMLFTVGEKVHKRTRKGKKSRLAIRKKHQAAREKQDESARLAKEKEEAEREKRTRRNREKKVKKKARDKAKKLAEGGADELAQGVPVED